MHSALGAEGTPLAAGLAEKVAANLCSLFMFFEKLGAISRFALAQNCQVVRAIQSQVIVKEGDVGDAFYIILTGKCVVYKAGQKAVRSGDTTKIIPFESEEGLGTRSYNFLADELRSQRRFGGIITPLLMGDTFGEKALFQSDSAARKEHDAAASVVASVDSYLLKVSADEFLASMPMIIPRRQMMATMARRIKPYRCRSSPLRRAEMQEHSFEASIGKAAG